MERKIYFKQKPGKRRGIKSLLKMGFNNFHFKKTYTDIECTKEECHPARRSFGDLLLICRTYFPNTTEQQLAKTLRELSKEIGIRVSYCSTIDKIVFYKSLIKNNFTYNICGHLRNRRGEGTHSFNEIEKLLNKNKSYKCLQ